MLHCTQEVVVSFAIVFWFGLASIFVGIFGIAWLLVQESSGLFGWLPVRTGLGGKHEDPGSLRFAGDEVQTDSCREYGSNEQWAETLRMMSIQPPVDGDATGELPKVFLTNEAWLSPDVRLADLVGQGPMVPPVLFNSLWKGQPVIQYVANV